MLKLKKSRWVKIHAQGDANFETQDNVMDITVGSNRAQAETVFNANTRTFKKAAAWLLKYLSYALAEANQMLTVASKVIEDKAANAEQDVQEITVDGEGWSCKIEKLNDGAFKTQFEWKIEEQQPEEQSAEQPMEQQPEEQPKATQGKSKGKKSPKLRTNHRASGGSVQKGANQNEKILG